MLPLRSRVDLGAMAMKGYSAIPKVPALLEPHLRLLAFLCVAFLGIKKGFKFYHNNFAVIFVFIFRKCVAILKIFSAPLAHVIN